jgi:hypothetical protein
MARNNPRRVKSGNSLVSSSINDRRQGTDRAAGSSPHRKFSPSQAAPRFRRARHSHIPVLARSRSILHFEEFSPSRAP